MNQVNRAAIRCEPASITRIDRVEPVPCFNVHSAISLRDEFQICLPLTAGNPSTYLGQDTV